MEIADDLLPTGDWAQDNEKGRQLATRVIDEMRLVGTPFVLGMVVRLMIQSGHYSGVAVGFCHHIGIRLM